MVKSGLSSGGSGVLQVKPKDANNDGLYTQLKIDGQLREIEITGGLVSEATPQVKGIVHLAEDREKIKGKAVQANDSRLAGATTKRAGIVRFATSGEHSPSLAIQANDSRLKDLPRIKSGVVLFTGDGKEKMFMLDHEYGSEPKTVVASPLNSEAAGAHYGWNKEKIIFTFTNPPPKESSIRFSWIAL